MAQASPIPAMAQEWRETLAAYQRRQAEVAALEEGASLMGVGLPALIGTTLMDRIVSADAVMAKLLDGIRSLDDGTAALVEIEPDQWAIVPKAVLQGIQGSFLGGWPIWVGAIAAVLAFAAVFYVANYYLEVREAEAQNDELTAELQARAAVILEQMCEAYPDQCEGFMARYQAILEAHQQPEGPGLPGLLPGLMGGGMGMLLVGLLLLFGARER